MNPVECVSKPFARLCLLLKLLTKPIESFDRPIQTGKPFETKLGAVHFTCLTESH